MEPIQARFSLMKMIFYSECDVLDEQIAGENGGILYGEYLQVSKIKILSNFRIGYNYCLWAFYISQTFMKC